ncbi:hypothetical protein HPP92_001240 [Vanilla planifolia]|uniref:Homeobox protein knotted-1-like 1 n=1 Tax=Vanilla planifolia TaxID=51239 RepID=A0A835RRC6_VANPL|nr:hypothetical protein HPP92_001240 [Vanilla planifolia]
MGDLYSIHPGIARGNTVNSGESAAGCGGVIRFGNGDEEAAADLTDLIKARIESHPRYPSLLSAYIECRKVGAPPEMAMQFDEIVRERSVVGGGGGPVEIGADPELDEFMDSYYQVLVKYKAELSKPFDDAVSFLSSIESQLSNLCKASVSASSSTSSAASNTATAAVGAVALPSDEALGSSDEEPSYDDGDAPESHNSGSRIPDQELKEMLLKKYSGYLSKLRKEFTKKRKKGKLPREARSMLLDWWNSHYKWPYPTEDEKAKLAELTSLDQKQINNWFINQRKRHWKPSEDMQLALVEGLWGGSGGTTTTFCFETGTIRP